LTFLSIADLITWWWSLSMDEPWLDSRSVLTTARRPSRSLLTAARQGHTCAVVIILVCGVLVLAGLGAIARWGGLAIAVPAAEEGHGRVETAVRRYLWWAGLVIGSGLAAGLLAAGAGGRLAMRLLAATSPAAQGAITEAGETVGEITLGGTLGFVVFGALPGALLAAAAFALIQRFLPSGRLAGLLFGLLLLVAAAPHIEPLRSDNPDFRFLGPPWLAVIVLGLVVIGDGLLTAAVMSWYSRRLPLPAWHGPARWHYLALVALLLLVFVIGVPVLALVAVGAVPVAVIARTAPGVATWWTSPRTTTVGRGLLAGGSLLALTGFVTAVGEIVS
jgi:hypothetical protein